MATRREISWSPLPYGGDEDYSPPHLANMTGISTVAHSEVRPVTPMQALMECAPGQEPELSVAELSPLRDVINDALESALDDRERWVFDALFCRKISLRALARELALSKTQVVRIRDAAREKLVGALQAHPLIKERLHA